MRASLIFFIVLTTIAVINTLRITSRSEDPASDLMLSAKNDDDKFIRLTKFAVSKILRKTPSDLLASAQNDDADFKKLMKTLFDKVDVSKNGTINFEEMKRAFKIVYSISSEVKPDEKFVKEKFDSMDNDKNGSLNLEEFTSFVRNLLLGQ